MKTLIAEDDLSSRLLLQTLLGRYGESHVAVTGKEAVQAYQLAKESGRGYDLICMDIMMPEMDGNAALREIRGLEANAGVQSSAAVKIIMTTALTDIKDVITSFQELCDAYLFKPIDKAKLLDQLQLLHLVP